MIIEALRLCIDEHRNKGLYRQRKLCDEYALNFSSNDYLSLNDSRELKKIYSDAHAHYPCGSGGSGLITGFHKVHQQCEAVFADFLQTESAILVANGFVANLAVLQTLAQTKPQVLIDKQCHASVYDGLALSQLKFKRFKHNDIAHMNTLYTPNSLVYVEGIYSMSGQLAKLEDITSSINPENLIIDDAHAIGVIGQEGKGSLAHHGVNDVLALVCPLGKAFAGSGAIIAGQKEFIEAIIQFARPIIYSTAVSPATAYGLLKTLEIVRKCNDKRQRLFANIDYFKQCGKQSPWQFSASDSPIQQLITACPKLALSLSDYLMQQNIFCRAIRQPTVTKNRSGLRVTLNTSHQRSQIDTLFHHLNRFYEDTH